MLQALENISMILNSYYIEWSENIVVNKKNIFILVCCIEPKWELVCAVQSKKDADKEIHFWIIARNAHDLLNISTWWKTWDPSQMQGDCLHNMHSLRTVLAQFPAIIMHLNVLGELKKFWGGAVSRSYSKPVWNAQIWIPASFTLRANMILSYDHKEI